jgi:quercetin dioxygenase-like cupin family protein
VRGVELVVLERHSDRRGSLLAFSGDTGLPFEVENVYFIVECPPDAVRGEHAPSHREAIIALSGSVTVDLDNGSEQESIRLAGADSALVISPGVWLRLREFTPETRLAVLSNEVHEEMTHYPEPRPELVDGAGP